MKSPILNMEQSIIYSEILKLSFRYFNLRNYQEFILNFKKSYPLFYSKYLKNFISIFEKLKISLSYMGFDNSILFRYSLFIFSKYFSKIPLFFHDFFEKNHYESRLYDAVLSYFKKNLKIKVAMADICAYIELIGSRLNLDEKIIDEMKKKSYVFSENNIYFPKIDQILAILCHLFVYKNLSYWAKYFQITQNSLKDGLRKINKIDYERNINKRISEKLNSAKSLF